MLFGAHVALRQPGPELDDGRIRVDVAEDLERFPDLGQALIDHPAAQQELADPGRSSRGGSLVADASCQLDRLAETRLAGFVAPGGLGRDAGPVQQLHAIGRVGRDFERLVQEGKRLVMRVERGRTIGGGPERNPCLGCDRGTFVALGAGPVCVEVVGRQDTGDLVVVEAFEEASRSQMPRSSIPARQGPVGHLSDEPMNEAVLPALRRTRVHVELEEFPPDEIAQPGLEGLGILS